MKLKQNTGAGLVATNLQTLNEHKNGKLSDSQYFPLLAVLADMLDMIARGSNCYVVIGSTSSKTAYTITMNADGSKDARYATDLEGLSVGSADWL